MIPLIGTAEEFNVERADVDSIAKELFQQNGVDVEYLVGTMIEIPRAALTADAVAEGAEFFSFGTNDLTQMTFGYSRDDVGTFVPEYVERRILKDDPFQVLDQEGVGELVELGIQRGRKTRPDLKVGICGEHGGEPASVGFCHKVGMNYVSCSPFRVPIARLAAAHAAQQMGLALGELFDPAGGEGGGPARRLFWILAVVIFLAIGGHRVVLGGLLETFRAVPPSAVLPAQAVLETAAGLLKASFELGLKIASPILVAMLLASVALGMLQKSMPQCNLLSVGLPARVLVGLVLLAASIAVMVPLLETALGAVSGELSALWRAAG